MKKVCQLDRQGFRPTLLIETQRDVSLTESRRGDVVAKFVIEDHRAKIEIIGAGPRGIKTVGGNGSKAGRVNGSLQLFTPALIRADNQDGHDWKCGRAKPHSQ